MDRGGWVTGAKVVERDKSNTELVQEIASLKEELFNLRFQQATGQLENPSRMKEIRKTIARIKTVITERELGEAK